jgi:hypothetical protein
MLEALADRPRLWKNWLVRWCRPRESSRFWDIALLAATVLLGLAYSPASPADATTPFVIEATISPASDSDPATRSGAPNQSDNEVDPDSLDSIVSTGVGAPARSPYHEKVVVARLAAAQPPASSGTSRERSASILCDAHDGQLLFGPHARPSVPRPPPSLG